MKISVIVPYEGYYQYLKDCLESLSEQENVEIETLLVGSQDDQKFQQLVDTYKDKISLNVIPCSIEEGVAKKRNLGLENATGDYIYFIDSDDYIMPQTLSCLLQDAMQKENIMIQSIHLPCRKLKMKLNLMNLLMSISMLFL